ncbi:serine hydrolase [Lactiplantibacillus mudanjiangensis]|uniref:Beta-lactamase [Lactobacillus koreensis] n=1 Tax=Lactiplantibacillus mudanjiangensis TaxID=1296538 RepID=A0A660E2M8_9LACO|nr:serine hydrolase [Lactiplantibacillus mudanjiangensis]VDG23932.1 beta-lactamase [Lactobacillus koreensis] [Lactiplantibacillus mudanjiangensis]VDG27108.1 beta-lactamase [Lactobacillus koreensis] [Lactiplantibacillus mudanjiangensis]VDG33986.1 beta-lactamase [Lactobacillus koreensis] [Lactiplantibacillus mudanjiangensis]
MKKGVWLGVIGILLLGGLVVQPKSVQATSLKSERSAIKKIAKQDLKSLGGRWSVQITRLGKQPLSVQTGNHKIGRQRSASTIKVFIMLTIYHRVQKHQIKLTAQNQQDLTLMIHNSDNAAANRLITRAGGLKMVTKTAHQFGFKQTSLQRHLLDTAALQRGYDNYTSVQDLTAFLTKMYRHQLLGKTYDRKMLTLLKGCRNHSKLPYLVKNATVYNKTGEYPDKGVQNDAALFKTKYGVYSIVVLAQSGSQVQQYRGMNRLGRDIVTYLNQHPAKQSRQNTSSHLTLQPRLSSLVAIVSLENSAKPTMLPKFFDHGYFER